MEFDLNKTKKDQGRERDYLGEVCVGVILRSLLNNRTIGQ